MPTICAIILKVLELRGTFSATQGVLRRALVKSRSPAIFLLLWKCWLHNSCNLDSKPGGSLALAIVHEWIWCPYTQFLDVVASLSENLKSIKNLLWDVNQVGADPSKQLEEDDTHRALHSSQLTCLCHRPCGNKIIPSKTYKLIQA